jgi:transcriptional regulator with XRE-family HTH domain
MNNIKFFRNEKAMTLRELSEKASVSVGYLSALENDNEERTNPTKEVMIKISNALDETVPNVFFQKVDKHI